MTGLLEPELAAWIEAKAGRKLRAVTELTGGASRSSFILEHEDGSKTFLRQDAGHGPLSGTPFTLEREFLALSSIGDDAGVPVARPYAYSDRHNAMLMPFVAGHTTYQQRGSEAEEAGLRRQLMQCVVALQRVAVGDKPFLQGGPSVSLGDAVRADLTIWRDLYRSRVSPREPLVEFAFSRLIRQVPDATAAPVLVHGDVGPGNFLVQDGRIAALIDWEMVRAGHPLEDLACIIARGQGAPFGAPGEHIANYADLSGRKVDLAALDWALATVLTRWLVGISMGLTRPTPRQNVPMLFLFRLLNGQALAETLCRLEGIPMTEGPFALAERAAPALVFAYSQATLADIAGQDRLPAADAYRLRGIGDLLAYLQSFIAYGPESYEAEEARRIGTLLGRPVSDGTAARAALCERVGGTDPGEERAILEHLRWQWCREAAIMRTALGERADNLIRI